MEIKQNIANNIIALRKKNKWTQAELADKINYSDKAVSKWERCEAVPDIDTLYALANLFGVTVDYFLHEDAKVQKEYVVPKVEGLYKKLAILFLFSLATALIALVVFMIGRYKNWDNKDNLWMAFVYCTPVFAILTMLFFEVNHIWLGSLISCCCIVLTITMCTYLELMLRLEENLWLIWLIALIICGSIVLLYFMRIGKRRKK